MISRILLGLGGTSFTTSAIRHAVGIAVNHQAEVHGVTVTDRRRLEVLSDSSGRSEDVVYEMKFLNDLEGRQEGAISALNAACTKADLRHSTSRETGDPFDRMISLSRYHDLMIFGLRSLFDGSVVQSEASDVLIRLVTRGVRPILAVSQEYRPVGRVLLAYSGSLESANAMKSFIQAMPWPDASISVVNFREQGADSSRLPSEMAAYCQAHGCEVDVEQLDGSPQDQLLEHAEQTNADAIVVGNSARSIWVKKLFGETAIHVIRDSTIPIFLSQ